MFRSMVFLMAFCLAANLLAGDIESARKNCNEFDRNGDIGGFDRCVKEQLEKQQNLQLRDRSLSETPSKESRSESAQVNPTASPFTSSNDAAYQQCYARAQKLHQESCRNECRLKATRPSQRNDQLNSGNRVLVDPARGNAERWVFERPESSEACLATCTQNFNVTGRC